VVVKDAAMVAVGVLGRYQRVNPHLHGFKLATGCFGENERPSEKTDSKKL